MTEAQEKELLFMVSELFKTFCKTERPLQFDELRSQAQKDILKFREGEK